MTGSRIRYLDGLRGILAIMVFAHHYFYVFYPDIIFAGNYQEYLSGKMTLDRLFGLTPLNILFNPGTAIHLFFILSGYVQSYHYFQKPEISVVQKSFIKRYFRLALPVVAVLLLVFIFHKMGFVRKDLIPHDPITASWSQSMLPDKFNLLQVIKFGLVDLYLNDFRYYQVLWTMPIELMNSWMVLILLFIGHQMKNFRRLLLFWCIVQLFFIQHYYSVAFTIGMLICKMEHDSPRFRHLFQMRGLKFLCLAAGLYFASYPFIGYEKSTVRSFYAPISFFEKYPHIISYLIGDVLLFIFLIFSPPLKDLLSKKIFRFFGDISFMFYLIHLLVIFSFSPWIYHSLIKTTGRHLTLGLTGLLSFGAITLISWLFYRYIDKPALHWSGHFTRKFLGI